ncbi:hypothetical protein SH584_10250 [Sphingomonas sp. LY29]|nr:MULTISPECIES: hypothetical protein [unclassified Sphingomonas]MEA1071890.1 hypothetical protein [Sphingomonas sp. LY160]WRP25422.1 hypothetical protein SH584_10250 [Sphingomonas sp. LY29]
MKRVECSDHLPPEKAAVAAALRRAFSAPSADADSDFERLLAKLR